MDPLTIKDWQLGVGESPYTGFAQMVNVDIYSKPGAALISNALAPDANSSEIVTGMLKWAVQDPANNDIYAVDEDGVLYKRDRGTTTWSVVSGHGTTAANGEGLAIWKGYLFYIRRFRIDVMELSSGSWTNDWDAVVNGTPYELESSAFYNLHPALSSPEYSTLVIGNGHGMDSLVEIPGQTFDPTDNPGISYIYNSLDMELGSDYRITCLEQQGSSIAIGTLIGINNAFNVADVFYWDLISSLATTGATVHLAENGVKMMKNSNNVLHVLAGNGVPRVFQAVTSQSTEAKRLNNVTVPMTSRTNLYPGAIDLLNGEVLFGIGSLDPLPPLGVYSLRNNAYALRYLISKQSLGIIDGLRIGLVKVISGDELLVGWSDDASGQNIGVDITTPNFYNNYTAYIESALYTVGTEDDPKSYEKVQVTMGKKLNDGDGIRIKARYSLDDDWVVIAFFSTVNTPAYIGRNTFDTKVANLGKFKQVQFRIELTTASDSVFSPELKEITFT